MKFTLKILATVFLFICIWAYFESRNTQNPTPLFTSGIYKEYRTLWDQPTSESTLEAHQAFTEKLRAIPNRPLTKKIFSETDASSLWEAFLFELAPWTGSLSDYLLTTQRALHSDPRFQGMGEESDIEDQFLDGNLPSWIARINDTSLIRMGQPMIHSNGPMKWVYAPQASPEFMEFVNGQKSHLYVNLMKRNGTEGSLSRSIEQLGETIPHLMVITLDKNSDFYHQNTPPKADFKTEFLNELLKEEENYSFPKEFPREELVSLLLAVQNHYFAGKNPETVEERKDFIELTYIALLDRLVEKYHPQTLNITCKQGIDRAPSLIALWLYSQKTHSDKEIAVQLLAPPLLFHNRASHLSRLERFNSAAKRLENVKK